MEEPTSSVCPICLKRVPAARVSSGAKVYLEKECPEHGRFRSILWRGHHPWAADPGPPRRAQETCCTLLEVTRRCDLRCRYCFADGGSEPEPSLERLRADLRALTVPGETLLQLSGGEPTLREDLPELVAAAKEAGCKYVQLNTNGLRLARDRGYLEALAQAGLSFVFLQFDGTEDAVYRALRGRPMLDEKKRTIDNCAAFNLGVALVPTLVPGVNVHDIGETLRFAISKSPAVRGVHFQPVSFFGRMPAPPSDELRLTLDQLVFEIERQTDGAIRALDLTPSRCDHPRCGFHGDFIVAPEGRLVPLTKSAGCCGPSTAEQNREFVGRRWQRAPRSDEAPGRGDLRDLEYFARRARSHGFTVTAMAFQDAGNLDLERLSRCSLHVFTDGRLVPFCSHYLSAWRAA